MEKGIKIQTIKQYVCSDGRVFEGDNALHRAHCHENNIKKRAKSFKRNAQVMKMMGMKPDEKYEDFDMDEDAPDYQEQYCNRIEVDEEFGGPEPEFNDAATFVELCGVCSQVLDFVGGLAKFNKLVAFDKKWEKEDAR